MNNPSIPPSISEGVVPVIQADRDRYVELKGWIDPHVIASVGKGWCDATAEMQALARHRLSFTPPVPDNALREALQALKPFARVGDITLLTQRRNGRGEHWISTGTYAALNIDDFRRARDVFAALKGSAS